ncbi:hypothetical protein [uncultured Algoriphagus sp.]|uniref:hypothetical protein n=1 Tax=uncultured Algoriphagus sp. TaxID=417365 RepID=UPI002585B098|nr:hypothetical protein [uncultured Algoriphagus sp.]
MALTILQQPQSLTFVGNIPELIVQTDGLGMTVNISKGATLILSEYYTADEQGRSRVLLRDLLDEYLHLDLPGDVDLYEQTRSFDTFTVEIISGESSEEITFTAIKGGSSTVNLDCAAFLKESWLTWQPQIKKVKDIQPEWLSFFTQQAALVKIRGYFSGGASETKTLHSLATGKHYTVNMTYSDLRNEFVDQPIYIDVWVENDGGEAFSTYVQRYVLTDEFFEWDDFFLFKNSVGGIDTIRLTGERESTNPIEVDAALFDDEYERDYLVTPRLAFEKNTGFFRSRAELLWAMDFFQAKEKYFLIEETVTEIRLLNPDYSAPENVLTSLDFKFSYTRQTIYLSLFKKKSPLIDPVIIGPGDDDFYLPPNIGEFPQQSDPSGLLFPVQKPGTPGWFFITWENMLAEILENIPSGNHNELAGLQGGDSEEGEYFHLTAEEHQKVQDLQDPAPVDGVSQTGTVEFNSATDVDVDGWKWIIAGVEYDGGAQNLTGITGTPAEYSRIDYAVGDDNGDVIWVAGEEDPDQLIDPAIPAGTILLARVIRTPAGDNTPQVTPEDLSDFVSKSAPGNQTIQSSITLSNLADPENPSNLIQVNTNGKIVIVRADRIGSFATRNLSVGFSRIVRIKTTSPSGPQIRDFQFKLDILTTLDGDITQRGNLYCALINDGLGAYVDSVLEVDGSLNPEVFTLVKVSATEYDLFFEHLDNKAILIYRPFALGPSDRYIFYRREPILANLPTGDLYTFKSIICPFHIDGGSASSVYLTTQIIDGGNAQSFQL